MSTVRQANPLISQAEARELGLDRPDLIGIYRNMLATRRIEERGNLLFKAGKLPGSYYTGRGNEGASVGMATAMGADDVASPLHRNLGVHVVRGRAAGGDLLPVHGPPGRRHRRPRLNLRSNDFTSGRGLLAGVSHLPAMIPTITGIALAFQLRREPRVAIGWCGDGAAARGDMHESMNLAGRAAAADRLRDRQQPVLLLDAEPALVRVRAPGRPRPGLRVRGHRGRRHRRPHRAARGPARDRARPRGRRADAARAGHAADGGPRRPRRRRATSPASSWPTSPRRIRSTASVPGSRRSRRWARPSSPHSRPR